MGPRSQAQPRGRAEPVEAEMPLGRYLASTEKRVRDRAIRSLAAFVLMRAQEGGLSMSPAELSKLWKGLFYCFWMSDKPLVQQQLAQELSELVLMVAGIDTRSDEAQVASLRHALAALDFYQGFWHTMQAEWLGVDKFRIDKYYLLMRRFLQAGCQLLLVHGCDALLVERYVHIMRGTDGPLSSNNVHVPDSITYHICDAFLAELDAAVAAHAEASPAVPTIELLAPFMDLAATSTSKQVHERVMSRVIDPFLAACQRRLAQSTDEAHATEEHEPLEALLSHTRLDTGVASCSDVYSAALQRLMRAASAPDTYAPSRRHLYARWHEAAQATDLD